MRFLHSQFLLFIFDIIREVHMDRMKGPFRVVNTLALLVIAYALLARPSSAAPNTAPPTTQFVYEGRINSLSGTYDLRFRLFDTATGGTLVGTPTVAVAN